MDLHALKDKVANMARSFREPWTATTSEDYRSPDQANKDLFHSARLKLTAFYFAVLLAFCLLLTFGVRAFTDHEIAVGNTAQKGTAHQIFEEYFAQFGPLQSDPDGTMQSPSGSDRYFSRAIKTQADVTREHLNRDFLLLDIGLLILGAVVSYWYAGRTLKPIEEAHEQQKRFTSDASHELRTPLTSMKLENEIFLRQKSFHESEARDLIASNLEEVERLEKLATNLLSLSKYEYGEMAHEPVVISELVDAAIEQIKRNKVAKKTLFMTDLTPAKVDVNRESIIELLSILLDNAVKYGGDGGKVEISGRMQEGAYEMTVRDYGPGIAEEDLPHIFERMYRGDKARSSKVSGHGIGLSLAQEIAEANEATLTATNAPGGGALFSLTLQ